MRPENGPDGRGGADRPQPHAYRSSSVWLTETGFEAFAIASDDAHAGACRCATGGHIGSPVAALSRTGSLSPAKLCRSTACPVEAHAVLAPALEGFSSLRAGAAQSPRGKCARSQAGPARRRICLRVAAQASNRARSPHRPRTSARTTALIPTCRWPSSIAASAASSRWMSPSAKSALSASSG